MFCTTFYSYKGGVGRTIALANVAARMAASGKKVLVVDFDLEAPGLARLEPFATRQPTPGLVDFIKSYEVSGVAGSIADYITTHQIKVGDEAYALDFLSAGGNEVSYVADFASIDWVNLYEQNDGFLLFEEIRAQWTEASYDYVFIDSRTGYTDVGGICTRQLPDLVVCLFFPNDQNLIGLKDVVREVRSSESRARPIDLFFVASRVPRLDDENGLLHDQLKKFSDELSYSESEFLTIWQYDSLSLLGNGLFLSDRPKASLTKSYVELARAISRFNLGDPKGALAYLSRELDRISDTAWSIEDEQEDVARSATDKLQLIELTHPRDSILQGLLSECYYRRRMLSEAAISADRALDNFPETATEASASEGFRSWVNLNRMRAFSVIGLDEEAKESALSILADEFAQENAVVDAILFLASFDFEGLCEIGEVPSLNLAEPDKVVSIARRLGSSNRAPEFAAQILERMLLREGIYEKLNSDDVGDIQITLIAGGKFQAAAEFVLKRFPQLLEGVQVNFNYVMSIWGQKQEVDHALFEHLYTLIKDQPPASPPANYYQCQSLVEAALGYRDALAKSIEAARRAAHAVNHVEFSCWSYRNVTREVFEKHLELIAQFGDSGEPKPLFLRA